MIILTDVIFFAALLSFFKMPNCMYCLSELRYGKHDFKKSQVCVLVSGNEESNRSSKEKPGRISQWEPPKLTGDELALQMLLFYDNRLKIKIIARPMGTEEAEDMIMNVFLRNSRVSLRHVANLFNMNKSMLCRFSKITI